MKFTIPERETYLSIFAQTQPETLKAFAENLLNFVGPVNVERLHTGFVAKPDSTVNRADGPVGEVLMAEARVRVYGATGHGVCMGCDRECVLALAFLDALLQGNRLLERVVPFLQAQQESQEAECSQGDSTR
ncbi:phosphonate C-P lyase system protein PhnG [Roseovarius pacificus]|uniref:phosphonate C-P lyase system protein PhnG n=1 Tax=Roseovarius pacificus TaxID=337701 RepID=UPI002A18DC25|nr:phosphonate C-P lyase system protein PhnG [Roseovarius pacificus]